jgi:hypothetical protein
MLMKATNAITKNCAAGTRINILIADGNFMKISAKIFST